MPIELRASKFAAQMLAIAAEIEAAAERAKKSAGEAGLASLQATTQFENRTGALRAAFELVGSILQVDPFAESRVVFKNGNHGADPHTQVRFLENGTGFIDARPMFGDAREVLVSELPNALEREMSELIRGA